MALRHSGKPLLAALAGVALFGCSFSSTPARCSIMRHDSGPPSCLCFGNPKTDAELAADHEECAKLLDAGVAPAELLVLP